MVHKSRCELSIYLEVKSPLKLQPDLFLLNVLKPKSIFSLFTHVLCFLVFMFKTIYLQLGVLISCVPFLLKELVEALEMITVVGPLLTCDCGLYSLT